MADTSGVPIGVVVGMAAATVVFLMLAVILFMIARRRKLNQKLQESGRLEMCEDDKNFHKRIDDDDDM